jgi:repressor LexA
MKELTQRQREVLSFISAYINGHTYPPTIREIADYFSVSVKGAHDHVTALKKKGYIKQDDKRSRTMEIVRTGDDDESENNAFIDIPILGTVAAGRPILSEENPEGSVRLPLTLLKRGKDYFAVQVRGDSMEGAGIMAGDTAIIEKKNVASNGEIVVAVIDEAAALKRFFRESSRIRLQSENPKYSPIYSRDVRILGRLSHIIRSY